MKATLWTTNDDWAQKEFMRASTDAERAKNCLIRIDEQLDIETSYSLGWTFVGTAEVTVNFLPGGELIANAVKSIDEQMRAVNAQYENAITRLTERKQELLCLPAPSQEPSND